MTLAPPITIAPHGDVGWDGLAAALRQLDARLARAVDIARMRFGEQAASDPYRGLQITEEEVERLFATPPGTPLLFREGMARAAPGDAEAPPLALLSDRLDLDDFDLDVLVLTLAPELDLRYERLYGYLQDDVTRRRPTVDLALNLLCCSAAEKLEQRRRFLPEAPLLRHGLIELVADPSHVAPPLLGHYLRLDGQMLRRLLGQGGLDASLAQFCELVAPCSGPSAPSDPATTSALAALAAPAYRARQSLLLHFHGPAGTGRRRAAEALAGALTAPLACDHRWGAPEGYKWRESVWAPKLSAGSNA